MTADRWLTHRAPAAPAALEARIRELVADTTPRASGAVADSLVDAAAQVLARLLRDGCATRHSALDLLAADAIATYAFEAAAEEGGDRMVGLTEDAMARIAALADVAPSSGAADAPGGCG